MLTVSRTEGAVAGLVAPAAPSFGQFAFALTTPADTIGLTALGKPGTSDVIPGSTETCGLLALARAKTGFVASVVFCTCST